MGIIIATANSNDGALESSTWKHEGGQINANPDFEDDARRGEGATVEAGNDPESGMRLKVGGQKWNNGDQTNRYEAFVMFKPTDGFAVPANSGQIEVVSAALRISRKGWAYTNPNDANFGAKDSIAFWTRDWSEPLSPQSWMDLMSISGQGGTTNYQPEAEISAWAQDRTGSLIMYEGGGEAFYTKLKDKLAAGLQVAYAITTWTSTQTYPSSYIWVANLVSASDVTMTPKYYPTLITRTQKKHALNYVGGASIQMTDGTAVFLRYDSATKKVNLYYQRVDSTTPVLIDFLSTNIDGINNQHGESQYYKTEPAFQAFGLTRDNKNNIYVTGPRGTAQVGTYGQKLFNCNVFRYNGNYTWTRFTHSVLGENTLSDADTHRGFVNNSAPVWVPSGVSPAGQLSVAHSRRDGQWGKYQLGVATLDAGFLQGSGSKNHDVNYLTESNLSDWWRSVNSSGSGLDAFGDGNKIRMASFLQPLPGADQDRVAGMTCDISSANKVSAPTLVTNSVGFAPHDPDGKVRAVWMGASSPYWAVARAGEVVVLRKSDGAVQKSLDFSTLRVSKPMPSRATFQSSQAWDVLWDSGDPDLIRMYFRDYANPRIINRISWNFITHTIFNPVELTPTPLGDPGSEIVAIRTPRQEVDVRCIVLDVAMRDGALSPTPLISIRDTSGNNPPKKPVVNAIASFNASGTKTLDWDFFDDNASDFAIAQDVEIRNAATNAVVHTRSHIAVQVVSAQTRKYRYTLAATTLTNDTGYQMRVRAYDSVDAVSEWSDWVSFSTTTTGGYVEITSPATDNELLNRASFTVAWRYSNSTPSVVQTGYRVRAYVNSTGAVAYDSGLLTSTATSATISGLTSDVEYRIEVTIRDSNNQTSGAGIRLVTPDFNNPSLPSVDVSPQIGYIEIRVTNPPPTGDNPVTVKNQIGRKEKGAPDSTYLIIGECPPNGVYQDWTVASGVEYTYKARGSST